MNPNENNIRQLLKSFDDRWASQFDDEVKGLPDKSKVMSSLNSLVNARNDFAHGGNPSASIANVKVYFEDSKKLMVIIDEIVK